MKKGVKAILSGTFIIVVFLFAAIEIIFAKNLIKYDKSYDKIVATISKSGASERMDSPTYIDFTYDGISYENMPVNYSSSSFKPGKKLDIYVNPQNPDDYIVKESIVSLMLIFGGIGGIFLIGFLVITLNNLLNSLKYKNKKLSDKYVMAQITNIIWNTHIEVNGYNPFKIYADYQDPTTGEIIHLKSKNIYKDPYDLYKVGDQIKIYIKDYTMKKYDFDLSKLENFQNDSEEYNVFK